MIYMVNITSEDGTVIELGKEEVADSEQGNSITGVNIFLDTIDNASRQKSLAMLAKIEIHGILCESSESKSNCKALFDWAKSLDKSQWYREVVVEIKTDSNSTFRTYRFEKMFVIDYKESYPPSSTAEGRFELYLTQKENNLKTIETY